MDYYNLIFDIPAIVTASTAIAYMLPFRIDVRFNPLFLAVCSLLVLMLPHILIVALALAVPVSLVQVYLGARIQGHDPLRVPWREWLAHAQDFRDKRTKRPVKDFLRRSYPPPDDSGLDIMSPGTETAITRYVPDL